MPRFAITRDSITGEWIATDESTGEEIARSPDLTALFDSVAQYVLTQTPVRE